MYRHQRYVRCCMHAESFDHRQGQDGEDPPLHTEQLYAEALEWSTTRKTADLWELAQWPSSAR